MRLYIILLYLLFSFTTIAQTYQWSTVIPEAGAFSSPRTADLNNDGTLDIVLGGGIENDSSINGVIALNGDNGNVLWRVPSPNQIFGSAIFQDITGDDIPDVFINGRDAQFMAINGSSGEVIWEFFIDTTDVDFTWFNFYNGQFIPDQNNDNIQDIVTTNGGDATALPMNTNRLPGYLMVLSGADGSVLAIDTMPDGRETYSSPLIVDFQNNGELSILYGSGGERIRGAYWKVNLSDLMNNDISNSIPLVSSEYKGFIAVPSLADLTDDGILDIIIPSMDSRLIALDGATNEELWSIQIPYAENYVSPTIGQFTDDDTPDVFGIFATGLFPFYTGHTAFMINGKTGMSEWSESLEASSYQLASPNALDWDNDGIDEIIWVKNRDAGSSQVLFENQIELIDFNDNTTQIIRGTRAGVSVFPTPKIIDLDNNNNLDIIVSYSAAQNTWYSYAGIVVERYSLDFFREHIAWGGYMGNASDGVYSPSNMVKVEELNEDISVVVYPNPTSDYLYLDLPENYSFLGLSLMNSSGQVCLNSATLNVDIRHLASGIYVYEIRFEEGVVHGKVVVF